MANKSKKLPNPQKNVKTKINPKIKTKLHSINVYRNRYNLEILKNKISHERELLAINREREFDVVHKRKKLIEESKDETQCGWVGDFCTLRAKKRKIEQLQRFETELQDTTLHFNERVSQLKPDHVASLIIFGNITSNNKEVFMFDSFHCNKCGHLYVLNPIKHANVCEKCHKFTKALFVIEDIQTDSLSFSNQKKPLLLQNEPEEVAKRANITLDSSFQKLKTKPVDRLQAYKKFLSQFADDVLPTPQEILVVLYRNFNFIHVFNSSKCRAAPIAAILKNNNLNEYAQQSARISRELNNEPSPKLSWKLIDILLLRFEEITTASSFIVNFDKLPSFDILTHTFLRAEKRDDLANFFYTHKAPSVLRSADIKIRELIDKCQTFGKADWSCVPRGG